MNILITNKYGAVGITCERHLPERIKHIYGAQTRPIAVDQTEFVDRTFGGDTGCYLCRQERERAEHPAKVRAALLDPKCSHTRFRPFGSGGYVTIYHRNETSPTGVLAAVGCDSKLFDEIYEALRAEGLVSSSKSPLSPTEGL